VGKLNTQERPDKPTVNLGFTTSNNNPQELGPFKSNSSLSGGDRDIGDRNRGYRTLNHKSSGISVQEGQLGKGGNN
jgi:hypothetical protein